MWWRLCDYTLSSIVSAAIITYRASVRCVEIGFLGDKKYILN